MRLSTAMISLNALSTPSEAKAPAAGRLAWGHEAGIVTSLFIVTIFFQVSGGAFSNEYGGFPDEAAHFVTALMVHDYAVSGKWSDPVGFAHKFYDHYPKIGLGHWPPLFYVVLAAWMMVFGTSHVAVMLFVASTTTAAAWMLHRILRSICDPPLALAAAIFFLALPLVQQYGAMVMMESAMAFMVLLGVWLYARYLESPTWRRGMLFGVVAAAAILTKGTAMALGAMPPLVILFTRRYGLLRRFSFWLPALVVAVLCAPWYAMTMALQQNGMTQTGPSLAFAWNAVGYYLGQAAQLGSVGLALAAIAGMVWCVLGRREDSAGSHGLYAAAGACLIGIMVLQALVPVMPDARHLVPAAPLLILFGVKGIVETAGHFGRFGNNYRMNVLLLSVTVAALFLTQQAEIPRKQCQGFIPAIEKLAADPELRGATVLVSSNSAGEGIAIAEIARRERRPGRIVKRASQLLSRSRWDGSSYTALAETPEEILDTLDHHDVKVILLDDTTPDYPQYRHHQRLAEMIGAYPDRFSLEGSVPLVGQNPNRTGMLHVYRVARSG